MAGGPTADELLVFSLPSHAFASVASPRMAAPDAAAQVPLRLLGTLVAEASLEELSALPERLSHRPEQERRRETALALHVLRQRLLRLLALTRWAPTGEALLAQASREKETLLQRDVCFSDAASRLAAVHHSTASSCEALYDVPNALRVLIGGELSSLLPVTAADSLRPAPLPAGNELLDSALRCALLQPGRPRELRVLRIAGGAATLFCAEQYEADVTLGPQRDSDDGSERLGGWALLRLRLLAGEPGAPFSLSAAQHHWLAWELHRRMASAPKPLLCLHAVLQELCATLARDALVQQARSLTAGRWAGTAALLPLPGAPPPPGFALAFWQRSRALRVHLDDRRRLCCSLAAAAGEALRPLQLSMAALDLEALLQAALRGAQAERLREAADALGASPQLARLPVKLREHAGEAPRLELLFPGSGARAALGCDAGSGALRLHAHPALMGEALGALQAHAAGSDCAAACELASAAWKAVTLSSLCSLALSMGLQLQPGRKSGELSLLCPESRMLTLQLGDGVDPLSAVLLADGEGGQQWRADSWESLLAAANVS